MYGPLLLIDNNGDEVGDVEWRLLIPAKDGIGRTDSSVILWNNYIISFAGLELTSKGFICISRRISH